MAMKQKNSTLWNFLDIWNFYKTAIACDKKYFLPARSTRVICLALVAGLIQSVYAGGDGSDDRGVDVGDKFGEENKFNNYDAKNINSEVILSIEGYFTAVSTERDGKLSEDNSAVLTGNSSGDDLKLIGMDAVGKGGWLNFSGWGVSTVSGDDARGIEKEVNLIKNSSGVPAVMNYAGELNVDVNFNDEKNNLSYGSSDWDMLSVGSYDGDDESNKSYVQLTKSYSEGMTALVQRLPIGAGNADELVAAGVSENDVAFFDSQERVSNGKNGFAGVDRYDLKAALQAHGSGVSGVLNPNKEIVDLLVAGHDEAGVLMTSGALAIGAQCVVRGGPGKNDGSGGLVPGGVGVFADSESQKLTIINHGAIFGADSLTKKYVSGDAGEGGVNGEAHAENNTAGAGVSGKNLTIINHGLISGGSEGVDKNTKALIFTAGVNKLFTTENGKMTGELEIQGPAIATIEVVSRREAIKNNINLGGTVNFYLDKGEKGALEGNIFGEGDLKKNGAGELQIAGVSSYKGVTLVAEGVLRAGSPTAFSFASAMTVQEGASLDLNGYSQTIKSLHLNNGTVSLVGEKPGATLTVTGPWIAEGNGAKLLLGAHLGDSSSVADRLILSGPDASASGKTLVEVKHLAGFGGLTTGLGIKLVEATAGARIADGAFVLSAPVHAGAYSYKPILLAGTSTAENGNSPVGFYLSSEIPAAESTPKLAAAPAPASKSVLAPALTSRMAAPAPKLASEPASKIALKSASEPAPKPALKSVPEPAPKLALKSVSEPEPKSEQAPEPVLEVAPLPVMLPSYREEVSLYAALPEQLRQVNTAMLANLHQRVGSVIQSEGQQRQAWGRMINTDRSLRQQGAVSPSSRGRLTGFQVGTDLWADSFWRTGLYVGQLEGNMTVAGFHNGVQGATAGSNHLRNQYLGAYLSWQGEAGGYADAVLQAGRHRYTATVSSSRASAGKGKSWLASLELGKSFALSPLWSIEPQLQLVHQQLQFDEVELVGARVQQDSHSGWLARTGVRVQGNLASGFQPFARINVYKAGSGTDKMRFIGPVATTDIQTPTGATSLEMAAGGSWQLSPRASLYGELGKLWDRAGASRVSSGVNLSLGVKLRW